VQASDVAGNIDTGEFRFEVVPRPVPGPRPILLVDDTCDGCLDAFYSEWRGYSGRTESDFFAAILSGYSWDEWDTAEHGGAPPASVLANYSTVIWNCGSGGYRERRGARLLSDLFEPRSEYLSSYVAAGGNLLVQGMCPISVMELICLQPGSSHFGKLTDVCCNELGIDGEGFYFDPAACGSPGDQAFPHLLFSRCGTRQMRIPRSRALPGCGRWQVTPDRIVKGCQPVDAGGLFSRYLKVDSLKAGGDRDNPPLGPDAVDWIPAANVTSRSDMGGWVTPIYYLDPSDPDVGLDLPVAMLARGSDNPRRPAGDPEWGDVVFLGVPLFFLVQDGAVWFTQRVLSDVFGEVRSP
jgi:hypothetical protein